jgi:spore germination protein KC
MNGWIRCATLTCLIVLLSGCWSKLELTERAFVLALAIDKGDKGKLQMTFQIYKPVSQFGAPSIRGEESAFFNVTLEGYSIFNIIRNNSIVTGRRSQFSHADVIIIGEELAKEGLTDLLDFFYRDPDIRLRTPILIAEGKARDYLTGKPWIENTLGSQVEKQLNFSQGIAGKSINTTLLDLGFGLKSESKSALVPYIMTDEKTGQKLVQGIALIQEDKMVHLISPDNAEFLLMLADQYEYGVLEIPCGQKSSHKLMDSLGIMKQDTTMATVVRKDQLSVKFDLKINGSIGELACTSIEDMADEVKYYQEVEKYIEQRLQGVLNVLQQHKVDALGIGHQFYLHHPAKWKKIKEDWPDRFARLSVDFKVKVTNLDSKMTNPSPFAQIEGN